MLARSAHNVFAFCVQTRADVAGGAALYDLDGLSREDSERAMQQLAVQQTGSTQLAPHLRAVESITVAGFSGDKFVLTRLGEGTDESRIIADFFRRAGDAQSTWAGYDMAADLAALRCRALVLGVPGKADRLIDLLPLLIGSAKEKTPPLQELARLQNLPCCADAVSADTRAELYAVQTCLIHLRLLYLQGSLDARSLKQCQLTLRQELQARQDATWDKALANWSEK